MKRAALHNLGCKVNAYETEKMRESLEKSGFTIVPFSEEAEVYVINTCSVTAIADKKSRQMIRRAKNKAPHALVVAAGCFVEGCDVDLGALGCDIALKNTEKGELVKKIQEWERLHGSVEGPEKATPACAGRFDEPSEGKEGARTRAFVKAQDGCDRFCSYCIIPYLRGRSVSRPIDSVVEEVADLCGKGYKEIVLTGIHLSSFSEGDKGLIDLCEAIDRRTEVKRLRLGSLEPNIVTEEFSKRLGAIPSICPHFHLSLQSGSDSVLKRMNRRYTTEEFARGVAFLRDAFSDPAITTDLICGFPGETEDEFFESKEFVERIGFYEMHVFPYSRRPGTRADAFEGQIPRAIRQRRTAEMIALGHEMSEAYRRRWEGRTVEALLETCEIREGRRIWSGFTREYIRIFMESEEMLGNTLQTMVYCR